MKWKRHGMVWAPGGAIPWARSHATCPTPLRLDDETVRVYVQCRDQNNVGRVGYVDVSADDPKKIVRVAERPVLDVGEPGCFDDNGVFQTSVVREADGRILMYYVGFELCHHIRYRLLTGLAVSHDDGETFHRVRRVPVLERSDEEPHFRCGPFVMRDPDVYRMWYVAGGSWMNINGKQMPVYDLRYIESPDGVHWPPRGEVVLPLNDPGEHGFGRPYVVKTDDGYRMFYSVRKVNPNVYLLGYAESADGTRWSRMDNELGLARSTQGWDSQSMAYSALVEIGGKKWLFYNGNDFGGTGFGVAELLES